MALREFGANAVDAEVENHAEKKITYDPARRHLRISSAGITLNRNSLLLGETTKANDSRTVGENGEGLKLGLLVLAREGFTVRIRNGRFETWVPKFLFVEKREATVFVLDIDKASRQVASLDIDVFDVSQELWDEFRRMFLDLCPPASIRSGAYGDILDGKDMIGRIYVKGVYVGFLDDQKHGYNLKGVRLSRDRTLPSNYELDEEIQKVWRDVAKASSQDMAALFDMLLANKREAAAFSYEHDEGLINGLAAEFERRFGDVLPAKTTEETELHHRHGKASVIVPPRLAALLQKASKYPSAQQFKDEHKYITQKRYAIGELTDAEQSRYLRVMDLFRGATQLDHGPRLSVVDFVEDGTLLGLHESGGDVLVSRTLLNSPRLGLLLMTIVHEYAHDVGDHGAAHSLRVVQLAANVIDSLLGEPLPQAKDEPDGNRSRNDRSASADDQCDIPF